MIGADFEAVWQCRIECFLGGKLGEAPDQGPRGTCLAHATTAAHEALVVSKRLSVEFLYWAAKQRDGAPCEDGTTPSALLSALEEEGQPEETVWPYDPDQDWLSPTYTPPAGDWQFFRRLGTVRAGDASDVIDFLNCGAIPVVGLKLTPDFLSSPRGAMDSKASGDPVLAYHGVAAVGHGRTETGESAVLIRNSWGIDWGHMGHGLLPASYLDSRLLCVLRLVDIEPMD